MSVSIVANDTIDENTMCAEVHLEEILSQFAKRKFGKTRTPEGPNCSRRELQSIGRKEGQCHSGVRNPVIENSHGRVIALAWFP